MKSNSPTLPSSLYKLWPATAEKQAAAPRGFPKLQLATILLILVGGLMLASGYFQTLASGNTISQLPVFGCLFAASFLMIAYFAARQEAARRQQTEAIQAQFHARLAEFSQLQNAILSSANYAIISTDTNGLVTTFNATAERWLGYSETEVVNKMTLAQWHHADSIAARAKILSQELSRTISPGFEVFTAKAMYGELDEHQWTLTRKDGSHFPVLISITALRNDVGNITGYLGVVSEIAERLRVEQALRESEQRMRLATSTTGVGIWEWNLKTNQVCWDKQMFQIYGVPPTSDGVVDYVVWQTAVPQADIELQEVALQKTIRERTTGCREFTISRANDGAVRHIHAVETIRLNDQGQPEWVVGTNLDITERKLAAEKVLESLQEKEALLREIHHRVKNNLQVISSILQLQRDYIEDAAAREVFTDCQGRIRTMALIHEQLYRSQGLAHIDFKDYLESLMSLLLRSQSDCGVEIKIITNIEAITLDADTAIPLGLIANELVANCLKHAFTGRRHGQIQIVLGAVKNADAANYQLTVQDDGCGLDANFDPEQTNSLGVRLVAILCEQLDGQLTYKNDSGAQFTVTFPIQTGRAK